MKNASLLIVAACCMSVLSASANQNWPHWRGPLANGLAPEANPPLTWSETKNIKWKVEIPGNGSATPIIWGNQIFIHTAIKTGRKSGTSDIYQWVVLCLDRQTGKTLWQKAAREEVPHEGHHQDHGFASYSPVTDGKNLYSFFGSRGLHCFDLQGNLRWGKEFGDMQTRNGFGEASSPALHGDVLVVNWDHEGSDDFIAALDKDTGKQLWRQARNEPTSWSTPFIVEHGGRAEVVVSATGKVRSYELATGKLLWEAAGLGVNAIPTPVAGHGMVFATTGYNRPGLLAVRLGRTGDLTNTDAIAWNLNRDTPYVASPLLYEGLLYVTKDRHAILACFDARTGKPHYTEQRLGNLNGMYASPVAAAGRIYLTGRNGMTLVIKPSEKFETLASNTLGEDVDASPAVVGNELFLRGRKHLYCIAEK